MSLLHLSYTPSKGLQLGEERVAEQSNLDEFVLRQILTPFTQVQARHRFKEGPERKGWFQGRFIDEISSPLTASASSIPRERKVSHIKRSHLM